MGNLSPNEVKIAFRDFPSTLTQLQDFALKRQKFTEDTKSYIWGLM